MSDLKGSGLSNQTFSFQIAAREIVTRLFLDSK
jgi:hypothetical protein